MRWSLLAISSTIAMRLSISEKLFARKITAQYEMSPCSCMARSRCL